MLGPSAAGGSVTGAEAEAGPMPGPGWPWAVLAANVVLVLVAVGIAGSLLRRARGPAAEPVGWYAEAAELAEAVESAATVAGPPADLDAVSRRLLPLAARIEGHVRAAPTTVEAEAHHALRQLGVACRRIAMEHRPIGTDPAAVPLEDRLASLREQAAAVAADARERTG